LSDIEAAQEQEDRGEKSRAVTHRKVPPLLLNIHRHPSARAYRLHGGSSQIAKRGVKATLQRKVARFDPN
jgi:hypothetical protein